MDESNRWKTRREAARLLNCHIKTVDNYLANGKLTKHKDGMGRIRVDEREIQTLITPVPVITCADR